MAKWKKDQTEFDVSVNQDERRGYQSTIPKPIMEILNFPKRIKFVVEGKTIKIEKSEKGD